MTQNSIKIIEKKLLDQQKSVKASKAAAVKLLGDLGLTKSRTRIAARKRTAKAAQ